MKSRWIAVAVLWGGAETAAVASTSPLREIGHTAITDDICANVVVHANSAIAATLHGDERLAGALARLRRTDFDDANPGKRAAVAESARLAADIDDVARRGGSEVKRLITLAGEAPRGHAEDLRSFATALGNVLERQAKMGNDLKAFVGALDLHDLRDAGIAPVAIGFGPIEGARDGDGRAPVAPAALARALAGDFERMMNANVRDETQAAERAQAAVTGC